MTSSPLPAALGEILLHWRTPEHNPLELGPRASIVVTVLMVLIIAYALYTNSPLMAITFILVGVVGYLSLHREPKDIDCYITDKGIAVDKEFYEFETVRSYHIYTEPPFENILSLETSGQLVPYVHIPTFTVSIDTLRKTLSPYLPEDKHEPGMVDTLEKLLHI